MGAVLGTAATPSRIGHMAYGRKHDWFVVLTFPASRCRDCV